MVLPIFLSRALRSAVAELLLRVVFAGIGLYLLDILTDAITAYRVGRHGSSRVPRLPWYIS